MANRVKDFFLDMLFPPRCINCGRGGAYICDSCCDMLSLIDAPACEGCGATLASGALCMSCMWHLSQIDGIYSVYNFSGIARKAIHQIKYNNLRVISTTMAKLLFGYMMANQLTGDILVPVPLHKRRLRERGYNQSLLLCRNLSRLCSVPVDDKSLVRSCRTVSQTELDREGRMANVHGVFECTGDVLEGKNVLLVDDVCTTGATLEACATALKAKGAINVRGLTFARDL